MAELGGILSGGVLGGAVALAGAAVVEPALEPARQEAEYEVHARILDLGQLAAAVAQSLVKFEDVTDHAQRHGYYRDEFQLAVQLALKAPGVAEALELYRRHHFTGTSDAVALEQLRHAFAKAEVEYQYWPALEQLAVTLLEPAEVAKAIHRGIMAAPGLLIASPPTTPGKVPAVPPSPLDPVAEVAGGGLSAERLRIMVGNAGLPLGLHEMLELMNRGEMEASDVQRGIAESNLRNEYQDVALALARRLLTPHEYAELYLRGWIEHDAMTAGTALSGMTPDDTELLYDVLGRPLAIHQVTTGLARGGVYDDPGKPDTPGTLRAELVAKMQAAGYSLAEAHAFVDAAQESNIRPQFYDLALANRYTMPGAFVVRSLLQDGAIDEARGEQILTWEGWPPDLAKQVATHYAGKAGGTSDTVVKSQRTSAVTAIRKAYLAGNLANVSAVEQLEAVGVSADEATRSLAIWDVMYQVENALPPGSGGPAPAVG